MTSRNDCPDRSVIESMIAGTLAAPEETELAEHLESCERCQETFESLARLDERLEGDSADLESPADQVPDTLMQKVADEILLAAGEETATDDDAVTEDLDLSFLPASEEGYLGRLGTYEITELVGQGGMGIVFKGHDARLNRCVAIKVLAPQLAANAAARKRFLREAQAAAAVAHEHVVRTYAVDEADGVPFIVMEYIDGISLDARIKRDGPLGVRKILRIGMQAAAGLAAAHAQGLVHRDIKPSNILLENGVERVKLTDFGLARAADDAQITQTGMLTGTPQYMSPEQARGETADQRSDLFSLGSVLYAMCTGRSPFRAKSVVATIRRVCDDTPRPLQQVNPDVPDWLAEIVERLLQKDPDQRLQSAAELAGLLGSHLAGIQLPTIPETPRVSPAAKAVERPRRRLGRRSIFVAAAVMLIFAGIALTDTLGVTSIGQKFATVIRISNGDEELVVITIPSGKGTKTEIDGNPIPDKVADFPPPPNAVDLLSLINPERDAVYGTWRLQDGCLAVSGEPAYCTIPYVFPDEYDLVAVVERSSGDNALAYVPNFEGQRCWAGIDWSANKGYCSGLRRPNSSSVKQGYLGQLLYWGRPTMVKWSIRRDGDTRSINVTCAGKTAFKWKGQIDELSYGKPTDATKWVHGILLGGAPGAVRILRMHVIPQSEGGRPQFATEGVSPDNIAARQILWHQGSIWGSVENEKEREISDSRDLPESFSLTGIRFQSTESLATVEFPAEGLVGLKHLVIRRLAGLPAKILQGLLDRPSLQEVVLANAPIRDSHLTQLSGAPELQSLDLRFTQITDQGLADLSKCRSLRRLCLAGNAVSDEGIMHLRDMLQLQSIDLAGTKVSSNVVDSLRKLPNLKELKLDYTHIDDGAVAKLAEMRELTSLSLSGTKISDAGLAQLRALKDLKELSIIGSLITDEGIRALHEEIPNCAIVHSATPPVDLLAMITSEQKTIGGSHRRDSEAIEITTEGMGYLEIPFTPPEEYLLQIDGECAGRPTTHVGLTAAGQTFLLTCTVAGRGQGIAGLQMIGGQSIEFNETLVLRPLITPKHPFAISALVSEDRIAATFDDRLIVDWGGDAKRLSKFSTQPEGLSIGTNKSVLRIETMQLTPIVRTGG